MIEVPPLRERKEDIALLARHFMDDISAANGKPPLTYSDEALKMLEEMPWTGNIRELRNVIERLAILCDKTVEAKDIELYVKPLAVRKE
jgi:DNA-binding NtrC family response regulator